MKLIKNNFNNFFDLCKDNIHRSTFQSIARGNTPGRLFQDDLSSPKIYAAFDLGNFTLHFGGDSDNRLDYMKCISYFKEEILTDSLKKDYYDTIKISFTSQVWKNILMDVFRSFDLTERERVLYTYNFDDIKIIPVESPNSISTHSMDAAMLLNYDLVNIHDMRAEVEGMWGSVDNFLKNGFGTCALEGNTLLSWCTAELLSDTSCGIGIETVDEAQKSGIGTAIASEFLIECKHRSITPYWDSWKSNIGSVKIAERIGFNKLCEYNVLFIKY